MSPEAPVGDVAITDYQRGTLRISAQFVGGGAQSRKLHDGAAVVSSLDVYAAGRSTDGWKTLRTVEVVDGTTQTLSLNADRDGNADLVLGDTRVRVSGKDLHGQFLCPEVLNVISVCDSDRRLVALEVFGCTVSERANCRGSGGSFTSEIDAMILYSPQMKRFVPVGKSADALAQRLALPQAH